MTRPASPAERARKRYDRLVAAGRVRLPEPPAPAARPEPEAPSEEDAATPANPFAVFMGCAP
ncbi:hypothetical protein [Parvularcula dongshanensis]|uniref:Uncharacterized protein n=1 Tax=Parvularcula dongshanensis TaxID=1173995 RepID=A0A840I3U2_9PROT|nr:hypothetical protein [Parvularcula dongshanensis]MBB4658874.1 hypothetical protein [Parvularcula dongshanensis]